MATGTGRQAMQALTSATVQAGSKAEQKQYENGSLVHFCLQMLICHRYAGSEHASPPQVTAVLTKCHCGLMECRLLVQRT